jgi:hypothetical protein
MFNGVVWFGDWLETMTSMATLPATLLARSGAATPWLRSWICAGRCMRFPTIAEWGLNLRGGLQFNHTSHYGLLSLLCQRAEIGTRLVQISEEGGMVVKPAHSDIISLTAN